MVYGYARCSTNEDKQDINRQIRELKSAGAEKVIFEFEHGDAKVKENLHMLLQAANVGDTIITFLFLLSFHALECNLPCINKSAPCMSFYLLFF